MALAQEDPVPASNFRVRAKVLEALRASQRDRHIPKVGPLPLLDDGVEVLTAVSPHELWLVARHVAFAVVVQHTFAGRIDGRHR